MKLLQWFIKKEDKSSGATAELLAAEFLKKSDFKIIETNFSCKLGEIDIIATHKNKLIFIEVKYRKNKIGRRTAKTAVDRKKQKKIILTSKWYLQKKYKENKELPACRFDVVTVEGELENPIIEHYPNAFLANH